MWKAAFTGRSESSAAVGGSASGRSSKDIKDDARRKKSSHSHRAESVISSTSRRDDDRDRERRRSRKASSMYDNGSSASRYETASSFASPNTSAYATAPTSRVGETRPLTESALRMLPDDDDEWEDEDKDARSEKKSRRKGSEDEKRRKSTRSEKERSRSRSRERREKKKESSKTMSSTEKPRDKERDRSRRQPELVYESRAIPEMGSFEQFPGQYADGYMGPSSQQGVVMSGALPSPAPQQQFPGQDQYRPPMPPQPNRAESYGHAAEYYLDEGQSVQSQPGNRPLTPTMLVNPDAHLQAASALPNPAQDTGHGSAADFYSGKVSPVNSAPTTSAKPSRPGKQSFSSSGKPSRPSRTSSSSSAAAAMATAAGIGALAGSSHHHSTSMQQHTSSSYYQQTGSSSKPSRPNRPSSDGDVYYAPPPSNSTYPPTLASTNGFGPGPYSNTAGTPGKQSTNSNIPLHAAGAAAAGFAAHQYAQYEQHNGTQNSGYNMTSHGNYGGGGGQGPPRSPRPGAGGYGYYPPNGGGGGFGMQHQHIHEHKGPLTRLKDGFFNLISSPEDTAKMEMYTEYIGVCKYCFDPRTSPGDAPRVHHYHKRRDSFEDLRRRKSYERVTRKGSSDSLRRQGSTRVDKESRYYASESSRRKRESGGAGTLGAGLAAAGAAAGANALFSDRKNFDDTYSVKSGHRESSAVRRRSRSSSYERRRRSTYGTVRPDKEEYVTIRRKDGTIERRKVQRSRSSSRERQSGYLGAAAAGAALGAAGLAAGSRRHSRSRSRSRSPTILGSFRAADVRSRRSGRRSPARAAPYTSAGRYEEHEEKQGVFGGFFSPPQRQRRESRERQKKRRGFFTFSNGSSSSSNSELAFGERFSSKTSLPLHRGASPGSSRTGRRRSRRSSDEHIAATVAGIGATAAALAAARKGNRISKRTSRPELGKRRDVRYSTGSGRRRDDTVSSEDGEWEDELPSDVDDESSVDGGLAFGEYGGKRLSSRQSLESVGSQSYAGGLDAWDWRWGGKDKKRRTSRRSDQESTASSFATPALATGLAAGAAAGTAFDQDRPITKPVYLDDTGRPLPSIDSSSTASGPAGPMQYVEPAPISDLASTPGSPYPAMPGAFDQEPPVIRPGPAPLQQPQPMSPARPAFTQSPPEIGDPHPHRPGPPRRVNSSPTRSSFAQDAALIGAGALATAGILAGGSGRRSKEPSNVRFGLTDEQQRKEDRDRRRDQKAADEERRRADRTRALKEEADRAARESRQEEVRRAREEENRKAADAALERERAAQREAEEQARREREREASRIEHERLEQEARDRKVAAAAAAAELERRQRAREEAQRQADNRERERERREWEEAYAKEESRLAEEERRNEDIRRQRESEEHERYTREQAERYQQERRDGGHEGSSGWSSVAAGAAAAATVGGVMAGKEHRKSRSRKSRDDSYYDEAHFSERDRPSHADVQAYGCASHDEAELDRRAREQYGRSSAGVEFRDGYAAAEIRPKNEHSGEPLVDDDLYNPDFFKDKRTSAENVKYAEFARKAADKVVADREGAYAEKTTYADFFAPKELLSKAAEGKTRSVGPVADNEVQTWHARDADRQSRFPSPDYSYGRSKHAPYGVPKLNVISPTPPPGSVSTSPEAKKGKGVYPNSPLSKSQDADEEDTSRPDSDRKSERSRSISWGEDKTHIYDVQTPYSYQERDSYINSPEMRGEKVAAGLSSVAAAGAAGAALHDIVVEDPSGSKKVFHEDEWAREEQKSENGQEMDEGDDVEDITPSPGAEPHAFYRQPFFDSVSDIGTGIFGMDSPGTEGAPPQRGFVEGEVDEPTPAEEQAPHIPGGFDDEMDDIYHPKRKPSELVTAENDKTQVTADAANDDDATEEPSWEPPLSKKGKKKREKAAKRNGSLAENEPATLTKEPGSVPVPVPSSAALPETEPADYFSGMMKEDKEKSKKQGLADIASSMVNEPPRELDGDEAIPAPAAEPEPILSKKEQKKRDKEAKKQGQSVADVTDSILAAGGIAAAAAVMDSTEDSGSGLSKKKKKGKKAKLGESIYNDPRDSEPAEAAIEVKEVNEEPASMPGSWDSGREEKLQGERFDDNSNAIDPFQYQVHEESASSTAPEPPASQEAESWTEFAEPKSKKKKNKRSSIAFNIPEVSSPLRSEIPMDDYINAKGAAEDSRSTVELASTNGDGTEKVLRREADSAAIRDEDQLDERMKHDSEIRDSRRESDSPRRVSPDDLRSVASAPTPDAEGRRRSRREEYRIEDYFDEPSYAYETQSVAASEPADIYERSKKSKRRSRHADDDDTASVVPSRSRREESPSSKKEKKGGLFGLFSRKSVDDYRTTKDKDSRFDGASLSRDSTRDSRGSRDDEDDETRRRRKKKSRDSQYGDDDEDTRSVKSESRRSRNRSEEGHEGEKDRRRRSTRADDHDAASPARSEPSRKHHRRRRTDDDGDNFSRRDSRDDSRSAVSESGRRHHHRRRTDENPYGASSRDQSFLGMRVEDLPPLPGSRPVSPDLAAENQERGEGSPADAEPGSGLVKSLETSDADVAREAPETPSSVLDTASRPDALHRPVSSTAVPLPLRFPFGQAPQTPASVKDRSHSFSSPTAPSSTPVSPAAGKHPRQGRPNSSEFRPLYLVERNSKTPEVEDLLPSLPSSKPSSRASSVHESDDYYQSAVEELETDSPSGSRGLIIDTGVAREHREHHPGDLLDSEELTPKASQFPHMLSENHVKQKPQFYTWEDFAREERMRDEQTHSEEPTNAVAETTPVDLPTSSATRSTSPLKSDHSHGGSFKSVAAAAMLGTAAVYAHHKSKDLPAKSSHEREENGASVSRDRQVPEASHSYPLPAPIEESVHASQPVHEPSVPPKGSKKEGKKQRGQDEQADNSGSASLPLEPAFMDHTGLATSSAATSQIQVGKISRERDAELDASAPAHTEALARRETDVFPYSEALAKEGSAARDVAATSEQSALEPSTKENSLDSFLQPEQGMEEGTVFASAAAHTMPVFPSNEALNSSTELADEAEPENYTQQDTATAHEAERPSQSYENSNAEAELTPSVIEQRTAEAGGDDNPADIKPAPKLTREESKKVKKKQKATTLLEAVAADEPSVQSAETLHQTSALEEAPKGDSVTSSAEVPEVQDLRESRGVEPANDPALEQAPQISFGMADFHEVAQSGGSGWHDSQAQAFQSMLRESSPQGAEQLNESQKFDKQQSAVGLGQLQQDQVSESSVSKRSAKMNKKKKNKPSTWPEADTKTAVTESDTVQKSPFEESSQLGEDHEKPRSIVTTALAAAAGAAGAAVLTEKQAKKKAKKDKKKQATTWSEAEAEPPTQPVTPGIVESREGSEPTQHEEMLEPLAQSSQDETEEPAAQAASDERDASTDLTVEPQTIDNSSRTGSKRKSKKDEKRKSLLPTEPETEALTQPEQNPDDAAESTRLNDEAEVPKEIFVDQPTADSTVAGTAQTSEPQNQETSGEQRDGTFQPSENVRVSSDEAFTPTDHTQQSEEGQNSEPMHSMSRNQSKKDKKKKKKKRATAASTEPEQEQDTEPGQMSVDESAFVDAAEDQAATNNAADVYSEGKASSSSVPGPMNEEGLTTDPAATDELPAQVESEPFAPVSRKKSKKDKKKKTQSWAEPDSESAPIEDSASRPMTIVDAAFVDANDTQMPADEPAEVADFYPDVAMLGPSPEGDDSTPITIRDARPESSLAEFAPVSKKNSKKDKKKKQNFAWNEFEDQAPPPSVASPEDSLATPGHREQPLPADDSAKPTEESERPSAANQDTQPGSSQAAILSEQASHNNTSALEPAWEQSTTPVKKKSKKDKKRRQTMDWTTPEASASAFPDDVDQVPALSNDAEEPTQPQDVPTEMHQRAAEETWTPIDASQRLTEPQETATEPSLEIFVPAISKKGEKSKLTQESESESTDVEPVPRQLSEPTDKDDAHAESLGDLQRIADVPGILSEEPSKDAVLEDFAPAVSKKKSKKDKKKRQTFDWTEPERESISTPEADRDVATAAGLVDAAEDTSLSEAKDTMPTEKEEKADEDSKDPEDLPTAHDASAAQGDAAAELEPSENAGPKLSRKQSKKDKKKKRRQQTLDQEVEVEDNQPSAEDAPVSSSQELQISESGEQQQARSQEASESPEMIPLPAESDNEVADLSVFENEEHRELGPREAHNEPARITHDLEVRTKFSTADDNFEATAEAEDPPAESSWTPSSKKKGRKDKKGRKSVPEISPAETPSAPEHDQTAEDYPVFPMASDRLNETPIEDQNGAVTTVADPETTLTAPPEEQSQDDFALAVSKNKKSKKSKKGRQSIVEALQPAAEESAEPDTEEAEQPTEPAAQVNDAEPTSHLEPEHEASAADHAHEIPADSSTERDFPKLAPTDEANVDLETDQMPKPEDLPDSLADEPQVDTLQFPASSKKSKKGRKSKSSGSTTPAIDKPLPGIGEPNEAPGEETSAQTITKQSDPEPRAPIDNQEVTVMPAAEEPQEDLCAAPSKKSQKKKGKKGRDSTAETSGVDTRYTIDESAVIEPNGESETLPEPDADVPMTDAAREDSAETSIAEDLWTASSSKKKKGKKGKKSESGHATPTTEDVIPISKPTIEHAVTEENALVPENTESTATQENAAPRETAPVGAEANTADDIWAEEDLATHEDHDAVRDLVGDPPEVTESSWQPLSSKKSKKKKGKRGSVAAAVSSAEPESVDAPQPGREQDVQSQGITTTESAQGIEHGVDSSKSKSPEESERLDAPTQESETRDIEPDASFEDPVDDVQENTSASQEDWSVPQSGKKSKENTKSKEAAQGDFSAADDIPKLEYTNPPLAVDPTPQTSTHEPAEAENSDVGTLPSKGKKGKKGKKAKQAITWEDDTPVEEGTPVYGMPDVESPKEAAPVEDTFHTVQLDNADQQPAFGESTDHEVPAQAAEPLPKPSTSPEKADNSTEVDSRSVEPALPSSAEPQETNAPEDRGNELSVTSKKSKKDKKKVKKNKGLAVDPPAQEESGTSEDHQIAELLGAATVASGAAAGAVAGKSVEQEPQEDERAGFSSKKSKDKKKAKKGGLSTPTAPFEGSAGLSNEVSKGDSNGSASVDAAKVELEHQDGAQTVVDTEETEKAWTFPEGQNAGATKLDRLPSPAQDPVPVEKSTAGFQEDSNPEQVHKALADEPSKYELPEHIPGESPAEGAEADFNAQDRNGVTSEPTSASAPHQLSHDIDFTAAVAAGLADSGFDPDLVINDPVFQRRASPSGSNAEANPEEGLSSTTTRRRRSKNASEASHSPENEQAIHARDTENDSVPADDFDNAVSQGLTSTGFDPGLLEKALASSNDQLSENVADDPEDVSFTTTSKRKKAKKGRKPKLASETDTSSAPDVKSTAGPTDATDFTQQHHGSRDTVTTIPTSEGPQTSEAALLNDPLQDQNARILPFQENNTQMASGERPEPSSGSVVDVLTVGRDEMDMDEMDRQYREYRRNKRKQKKLKAAAKAAGLSDNLENSTAVSDSDTLSRSTHASSALARTIARGEVAKTHSSAVEEWTQEPEPLQSPTNDQSVVQSVFPSLERVKRRAPSIPSANDDPIDRRSSSSSRRGLLQHTSEVSQLLPVAVPRSPPRSEKAHQEADMDISESKRDSTDGWAVVGAAAGLGAAVAAAAREGQARRSAANESAWSFDALEDRNKAIPESPSFASREHQPIRHSGYQEAKRSSNSPERTRREIPDILHTSSSRDSLRERRSLDPLRISTTPDDAWVISSPKKRLDDGRGHAAGDRARNPSVETPLKPTSKERASYLFQSPPDTLAGVADTTPRSATSSTAQYKSPAGEYFKTRSTSTGSNDHVNAAREDTPDRSTYSPHGGRDVNQDRSTFSPVGARESHDRTAFSPIHSPRSPSIPLDAIPEEQHVGKRRKADSDVGGPSQIKAVQRAETPQSIRARQNTVSPGIQATMNIPMDLMRSTGNPLSTDTLINRLSWPSVNEDQDTVHIDRPLGHRYSKPALPDPRSPSAMSNRSNTSGTHFKSPQDMRSYSRTSNRSSTPSLRRTSLSGDLRAVSRRGDASGSGSAVGAAASPKTIPFEPPPTPPLNNDELINGSASRAADMNDDVFQGYGDAQQSQVSPTRPPSVRKRQSMHITDLETRVNELAAENRALQQARQYAEQTSDAARDVNCQALQEGVAARDLQLQQKDAEINQIKAMLQPLQEEVARLTEINGGLTEANRNLVDDTNGRYATLQAEHNAAHEKWRSASRELETMRSEHGRVTSGMRDIVEAEIASALADKNAEILRLREQLDIAAEQIRSLQVQIQSSKSSDWLVQRDEDYFDGACQKLCQHVQQWVLRFSKLSDNRVCHLSTELKDDKLEARLDNAIVDGSDVDKLLSDRVRRRDVFMSVVMTMVWEYVFTRYLFGMDREQRQKLKALEKTLAEVGPPRAVAHWRATTLTLLSKRPTFATQCGLDTEAVAHEIFNLLCTLLPPPQNAQQQLFASLQKVMGVAVNLSIEMRTQRAEYIMLPPLQPEYDTNGDLVRKVHFNADLMNERSGFFSSNEELAADQAVVKIVLFPLVVKKGDDNGEGEEEIVVCPAQVLVQNDGGRGKKVVRVMSGALPMDIDHPMGRRQSRHSMVSEPPGSVAL